LLISDIMYGDVTRATGVPAPGNAWAEPGMLARIGLEVGDRIIVGDAELKIERVLEYQPSQMNGGMASLAPGMMVNQADIPSFNVLRPGSRATYREFYAGEEAAVAIFKAGVEGRVMQGARLMGLEEAGEQINDAIERAQRFLTLASLVTVILAAVATAMASRRYALRHLDTIALLKSVGATQGFVQNSTLIQLVVMIAGTAAIGSVLGFGAQFVLVTLAKTLFKIALPPTQMLAGLLGLLTAATITVGFALPHLLMLKNTAPIRVLRRDIPPPQLSAGLTYGIAIGTLLLLVFIIVRDLKLLFYIAGGVAVLGVLSFFVGWLLVSNLSRFRGAAGVAWRYGLANISRRGTESIIQIVAFALSLNVLLILTVVRGDILEEWQATIPTDAPNYFLINIAPEQWPAMQEFFIDELDATPDYLPFIRGKIVRIKGIPVDEYDLPEGRGQQFISQENNMTWQGQLPESNRVIDGEWWGEDYSGELQASLDERMAKILNVSVGDTLGINVGGEEFDVPITSFRGIEWDSLQPNFYLMLSPGVAEELPQTYIASVYVPPTKRLVLNRFVRTFPGTTVFDLEVILTQVRMVIDRASMSVQYVFLFTLLAGVVVLLAAIQATRDERRFESALLHTLGAQRAMILKGLAVEFTVLGCLAGLLAALGAMLTGWVIAEQIFNLDYTVNWMLPIVGVVSGSIIVGLTGIAATRKAVSEPPVAVLREL
ncbi:MAG: FtsX-like permease family protein, partial [Gammaproteobacteria bacterium]|nr:FtsX-like permease family protein [Gammaproteobacteria bacterium]